MLVCISSFQSFCRIFDFAAAKLVFFFDICKSFVNFEQEKCKNVWICQKKVVTLRAETIITVKPNEAEIGFDSIYGRNDIDDPGP
jgi:hypothetical protein